jgi:hypothetical protein
MSGKLVFTATGWRGRDNAQVPSLSCLKIRQKPQNMRQKRLRVYPALQGGHLSSGNAADFGDNEINGIVAFKALYWLCERKTFDWK